MYTITKEFHFSAAHQLDGLPPTHQCARLHGHNYIVVVELQAQELDEHGFVRDYGDLAELKHYIDGFLDHKNLNDLFVIPTTAENIAKHLFSVCEDWWPELTAVRVSETPKTWAEYRSHRHV